MRVPAFGEEELFIHRFPQDMPPGEQLAVTLNDLRGGLLNVRGLEVTLPKKPSQPRQKRFTRLELDFPFKVAAQELHINLTTSEVSVFGRIHSSLFLASQSLTPSSSTLTTYYERGSKEKVLHAYYQGSGPACMRIEKVLRDYDQLYCIDTNSMTLQNGHRVAVTTAIHSVAKKMGDNATFISSDMYYQDTAIDPVGNPELAGIWTFLRNLKARTQGQPAMKTLLITDTEYGKVKGWNQRTIPFFGEEVLPEGFDIFYATSDAGTDEFMPNRLMKACDNLSTQVLRQLYAGK
ncbi:hypothetical protein [Ramlibacter humi]|uniref:Uncharacterized protein n=1 Tax=Ramlibacter humi TaxID=2530451 RepID=A0A4Z0CBC4_9BURK|nr:hypothetical protein [Ramlibacter humi]TFZ08956.1 hypothetical protein EZ216_07390 [Ramlibacter humi]